MNELLEQLNTFWNNDGGDPRYKGEDPRCEGIQDKIAGELNAMTDEELVKTLEEIPESRLEQVRFVLECMEDDRECVKPFIV